VKRATANTILSTRKANGLSESNRPGTGDPVTGDFSDDKVIKQFGDVPDDLSYCDGNDFTAHNERQ
jgi:hypothetical protein